jgi:hypothetical protein
VVREVVVPEVAEEFARLRFDGGGLGGGGGEGSGRGGCGWCGRAEVRGDVDVEDAVAGGDGLVDVGEDAVGLVGGCCQRECVVVEKRGAGTYHPGVVGGHFVIDWVGSS